MATEQGNITESVIQIATEAGTAAVQALAMARVENNQRAQNAGPKLGRPIMRQLTFDWSSTYKYVRTWGLQNGGNEYVSKL